MAIDKNIYKTALNSVCVCVYYIKMQKEKKTIAGELKDAIEWSQLNIAW